MRSDGGSELLRQLSSGSSESISDDERAATNGCGAAAVAVAAAGGREARIEKAVRLLRANGYTVTPPPGPERPASTLGKRTGGLRPQDFLQSTS